jgi:AraC family transcriptional regulator
MAVLVNPSVDRLGVEHVVVHGRAAQYEVRNFRGPISIKTVRRGRAIWRTEGRPRAVAPGRYLLINELQPYDLEIDSVEMVETFCLFFRHGFVEDVCRAMRCDDTLLLTEPLAAGVSPLFETIEGTSPSMHGLLSEIERRAGDMSDCTDLLADLVFALLTHNAELQAAAAHAPGSRAATRCEIVRRVLIGRDRIESDFDERLSLEEIASTASMSPFHFHRSFRRVFGSTPLEHLTRLRLEHAQRMLRETEQPIQEIALAVGFESLPSFTTLFRRRVGDTPGGYRAKHRKIR